MNFFEKRRLKKTAHLARHLVRHALNMREDVAPAAELATARAAEEALHATWAARDWDRLEAACESAGAAAEHLMPPRSFPRWRENVEVLVVAISMAMACRTYFIQPFKIPTGSMQPTLNGITVQPQDRPQWQDRFPVNLVNLAVFGERYVEVKAKASGRLEYAGQQEDQYAYRIGGETHRVHLAMRPDSPFIDPAHSMHLHFQPGDRVEKGQVIASGRVRQGDHIFVNKVRYQFTRPRRGQIIVFDTNYIPEEKRLGLHILADTFYIKRLVGLPGETISIRDRHLVVDGNPIEEPFPFKRLVTDPNYHGYVPRPGALLNSETAEIRLGKNQFLPFGDNTTSSLDGRYFGPVTEKALVGPSFFVYWPFGPHWGLSR